MKNQLQKELKPIEALEIMLLQRGLEPTKVGKRTLKVEFLNVVPTLTITDDNYLIISCENISKKWHFKTLEELQKLIILNFPKPH